MTSSSPFLTFININSSPPAPSFDHFLLTQTQKRKKKNQIVFIWVRRILLVLRSFCVWLWYLFENKEKKEEKKMVAEAEVVCQQSVPMLDVPFFNKGSDIEKIDEIVAISSPVSSPRFVQVRVTESVSADLSTSQLVSLFFPPRTWILMRCWPITKCLNDFSKKKKMS